MTKRIISLILILLLISPSVFASDIVLVDEDFEQEATCFKRGVDFGVTQVLDDANEGESSGIFSNMSFAEYIFAYIEEYIAEYNELPTMISDLAQFGVKKDALEKEFVEPMFKNPYMLLSGCSYSCNSSNVVTRVMPKFLVSTVEEIPAARKTIEDGVKEYVELAQEYDTDLEKLLAIHDKMVELCEYDHRVVSSDPNVVAQAPRSVYFALGVFRDKLAVCQGYSIATYLICRELGIGVDLCVSDEADHMWNYINLNGKWYHYDMTHDDPDETGNRAYHRNFMVSDSSLPSGHGTDWRIIGTKDRYDCSDTTYESNHFFNMEYLFKGFKDSDGLYNATINIRNTASGIDSTPVTFKSPTLYTGAIIVAPFIASGNYTTTENGETVTKRSTNLYSLETSVGPSPKTFLLLRRGNRYFCESDRNPAVKGELLIRRLFTNAPPDADLTQFTSFILGTENLTPYSMKYNWR